MSSFYYLSEKGEQIDRDDIVAHRKCTGFNGLVYTEVRLKDGREVMLQPRKKTGGKYTLNDTDYIKLYGGGKIHVDKIVGWFNTAMTTFVVTVDGRKLALANGSTLVDADDKHEQETRQ